tara:strand:- start:27966 stop:28238 length:273 start_codon:yes stop_codon:yes gene_type:complete
VFGLSPDQWDDWSAIGLLTALCVVLGWLVLSGRLVPRKQVDAEKAPLVSEVDFLRRANSAKDETISVQAKMLSERDLMAAVRDYMQQTPR